MHALDLLGDPVRRRIVELLADGERSAGEVGRVVHGDQRFTSTRPIVAGDLLTARLTVSSVKTLGAHSMVTAETAIVDEAGDPVVTAISTLVVRGDD